MTPTPPRPELLFDVLIFEYGTGKVASVVGVRMRRNATYDSAERRMETALSRCNDRYGAVIVEAGSHDVGDILDSEKVR